MIGVALDTNIWAYDIGVRRGDHDAPKVEAIRAMLPALFERADIHVASQTLAELYHLLTRTALSRFEAVEAIERIGGFAQVTVANASILDNAYGLAQFNRFQIFDAIILSCAIACGARVLLSEDMQHGSTWQGTTILSPFAEDFEALMAKQGA